MLQTNINHVADITRTFDERASVDSVHYFAFSLINTEHTIRLGKKIHNLRFKDVIVNH